MPLQETGLFGDFPQNISWRGGPGSVSTRAQMIGSLWSSPRAPRRVQPQLKAKTSTSDLKPELVTFKLERDSLMPEMVPLIPHIGHFRPVYGPLRFKTVEWSLFQTWNVPCVIRIRLLFEFNTSGIIRPFSYLRVGLVDPQI